MKVFYQFVFILFVFSCIEICPVSVCRGAEKETKVINLKAELQTMLGDYAVQHSDKQTLEYLRKFVTDFYEGGKALATDENKKKNKTELEAIQKEYMNEHLKKLDAYFQTTYHDNSLKELYLHQLALTANTKDEDFRYKVIGVYKFYTEKYYAQGLPFRTRYDLLKAFSDVPEPLLKLASVEYINLWLNSSEKVNGKEAEKLLNTYKNDLPEYAFVQDSLITGYRKRPSELFSVMAYTYLDKVNADEIIRRAEACKENPKILEDFAKANEWWVQCFACAAVSCQKLPNEQELFGILEKSSVSGMAERIRQIKGLRAQSERISRSVKEQWLAFMDLKADDIENVCAVVQQPLKNGSISTSILTAGGNPGTPPPYKDYLFSVLETIREPWLAIAAKGDDLRKALDNFNSDDVSSQYGIVMVIKMKNGGSHFLRIWFPDNEPAKIGIKMEYGGSNVYGPFFLTFKDETPRDELLQRLQNIRQYPIYHGTIDDNVEWIGNNDWRIKNFLRGNKLRSMSDRSDLMKAKSQSVF